MSELRRRLLSAAQNGILARPGWTVTVCGALVLLALSLGAGVEFRTSRTELAPADDPAQMRLAALLRDLAGGSALIAAVETEPEGAADGEGLRQFADLLAADLRRSPRVAQVFHRVDPGWFQERGLHLLDPALLGGIVQQLDGQGDTLLAGLEQVRNLADLNRLLVEQIGRSRQTASRPEAASLDPLLALVRAERRFLAAPDSFLDELESGAGLAAGFADAGAAAGGGYLANREGTLLFLFVLPTSRDDTLPVLRAFVGDVRVRAEELRQSHPGFRVALTGEPAITVEEMDTVRRDTRITAAVAAGGVGLLMLVVFRWKSHSLLVMAALGAGLAWAFGAVELELGYLNVITSAFISTLVGVGVAYAIHPVSEYEMEGAHTADPVATIRLAFHRTGAAVATSGVTTSLAFFSILFMQFPGFAELGLVAGVGVLLCLAASLVTLPAMLVMHGRWRRRRGSEFRRASTVDRFWVGWLADAICRFPRLVTGLALLLTAALGWAARDVDLNTNILDLLPVNAESLHYQRRMMHESDLSPLFNMVVADDLDELRRLQELADDEPTIVRFQSILRFLPTDPAASAAAVAQLGKRLEHLRLPESAQPAGPEVMDASLASLEQALLDASDDAFAAGLGEVAGRLEEVRMEVEQSRGLVAAATPEAAAGWEDGQRRLLAWVREMETLLRSAVAAAAPTVDSLPAEIREQFRTRSGRYVAFLHPRGDIFDPDFLAAYAAASIRVSGNATGFPIVFQGVSARITGGFNRAVAVGTVLVTLVLLIDYRSLRDTVLALIPLGMGVIWMMGGMRLAGLSYNFANLVAIPLIIGVGIDNGVHVIHRFKEEGRQGITLVLRHTGRAILIASLTTMIGFGSLALASHRGLASLGMILLMGVGACLVTSTVVLPNLLLTLGIARR